MAKKTIQKVYWDANAFLGFLKGEKDRVAACNRVIQAAKNGEVKIWSSSIVDRGPSFGPKIRV